jgi:hypothetical protein
VRQTPVLSSHFEASIPGLYLVGMASKYSFGPVMQFACRPDWTARRIVRRLARGSRRRTASPGRQARYAKFRRFCSRGIYPFWREVRLERVG